jgi:hypothetical protein
LLRAESSCGLDDVEVMREPWGSTGAALARRRNVLSLVGRAKYAILEKITEQNRTETAQKPS